MTPFSIFSIIIASALNHAETVSILLSPAGNASLTVANPHGSTALHIAAHFGHVDVLRILLQHNRNHHSFDDYDADDEFSSVEGSSGLLDKANRQGTTPVLAATKNGKLQALTILHEYGADFSRQDQANQDCVMMAALDNSHAILDYFASIAKVDSVSSPNFNQPLPITLETPFHVVVRFFHVDTCKALLRATPHVDLTARNADGKSAYHIAVDARAYPILKECLCHSDYREKWESVINMVIGNTNSSCQETTGMTPLQYAIFKGDVESVKLLARVSDFTATASNFSPPLFMAIKLNNLEVVETLLTYASKNDTLDVNLRNDSNGHTALITAATLGLADMCELLVEKGGADMGIVTKKGGKTALQKAKKHKMVDVVKILSKLGTL